MMGLGKRSMGDARIADGGAVEQYQKKKLISPFLLYRYDDGTGQEVSKFNFRRRWVLELRIELEFRFPTFHNVELY